ncbi:hypothetical protein PVK06_044456 [Gossypium arboreum]|uniref:Uncharacterized protein n=1 Tax=Gossypium arboreum TaxID=29729 RepID=A0ABR0MRR0_GOSAR|nr:hypothetical protein PVK06_044456 [Gossypium arboreum]
MNVEIWGEGVKVPQSKTIIDSVSDEDIQKLLAEATQVAKKQEERMIEMKNEGLWMLLAPKDILIKNGGLIGLVSYVKPYVHNVVMEFYVNLLRSVSDMHNKLRQKVFVCGKCRNHPRREEMRSPINLDVHMKTRPKINPDMHMKTRPKSQWSRQPKQCDETLHAPGCGTHLWDR